MKKETEEILEALSRKLDKDSKINDKELDNHLMKVSVNLAEWTEFLQKKIFEFKDLELKLDAKYKELYMYYKYEFDLTLDKQELKTWIFADSEYTDLKKTLNDLEVIISFCERAIKVIEGTAWNVKSIIEYRKVISML